MSFIGKNIRKIRAIKKLSQQAFADQFSLTRTSVGSYEEGRAEPKIETIIQIANFFGISVDVLLTKELTVNELYHFDIFKIDIDKQEIKPTPIKPVSDQVLFVPISLQTEYTIKHNDKDFLEKLPMVNLPNFTGKNHRAFEMQGNEMQLENHGIFHGDILFCKKASLDKQAELKAGVVSVAIANGQMAVGRMFLSKNELELKPDNPNFESHRMPTKSVLELWEVIGNYSSHIGPPTILEDRVLLIEKEIADIKKTISQ